MKFSVSEINAEFIDKQAATWVTAAAEVARTADAYLADIDGRKQTLQAQAREYQTELDTAKKERDATAAKIADLSSRGEIDAAAAEDVKLEEIDKRLNTLERKLRIVKSADPKGDPKLYTAAQEAYAAMTAKRAPYVQRIDELSAAVTAEIDRLEAVKKELSRKRNADPGYYAGAKFEKVTRHFRDLDRLEREAKEKATAERKAQAAAAGHTRYTFTG